MKRITTLLLLYPAFGVTAADSDIEVFMSAFHENPSQVMNALPQKEGDPYPAVNMEESESIKASVRDAIVMRATSGAHSMRSANLSNDNPARLVDLGYGLIRNLDELYRHIPNSKRLHVQPWSDTYWPLYSGAAAWRYGDRELRANNWKEHFNFSHIQKPVFSFQGEDREDLSPAEKYDLLVGDNQFTLSKRSWDSGKGYYESGGYVERWMGLCHGWAAAAYMLPRPTKPVTVPDANGEPLKFYPSDIKALGTLLWAEAPFETRFIGGRCNVKNPEKDENGRVIEPDCGDTNPASWHLAVLNQLGLSGRSLIMDATYDYQVWNQPILGYSLQYFNPQTYRSATNPADAIISLESYDKDRFSSYRSPLAASIVGVQMQIEYMVETYPTHRSTDMPRYDGISQVTYYYDLEVDANGQVIGGEWYQNSHPDFLWTPTPMAVAKSYYDGYGEWDMSLPIPQNWQYQAPRASRFTQPMTAVVSALFAASSGEKDEQDQWKTIKTNTENGSQCLDVEYSAEGEGSRIFGWRCNGRDNQQWKLTSAGKLVSKSNPDLCLDQRGLGITLERCNTSPTQQWRWQNGQLKNRLDNALKWNERTWLVVADVQGSEWYFD
ncbi:ricin-type beta-trefoil lectin domain protein [Vibrio sp. AND4]|uniref:ricin-type beta-trefoil lectin domain protein n=1 Tax=Vibrio sp. AND4 TaxID=314289 RepID=UPI00015EFCA3|nr:ricin-type beta-trefoil lectin domain protein [Vibrio sp. AND4]EDP59905.1 protein containing bacterial pre-peptidase C-terminal domain [Vibrio sp. AND4]